MSVVWSGQQVLSFRPVAKAVSSGKVLSGASVGMDGAATSEDSRRRNADIARLTGVLSPADLSDSTLSYTETEAASSSNATPGEFSGWCVRLY